MTKKDDHEYQYIMKYDLTQSTDILGRTPDVLHALLSGLPDEWLHGNEGPNTWSAFQVVGHLIENEQTNFLPRTLLILSESENRMLKPINMEVHLHKFAGYTIEDLLLEFGKLRSQNLDKIKTLDLSAEDFEKTAFHPKLGMVELSHVLSTWVAHDLVHIGQITRVMAKYKEAVGPFIEYLTRIR